MTPATDDIDTADFVDIDTLGKLDLPTLPVLKGEKDWKQWWKTVTTYFEVLELEKFLTEDIREPTDPEKKRKWLKGRRFIMIHLLKAISSDVQKDMEVLGWDFRNPHNTVEIARKAVTKVSSDSLRQLVDSWNHLNAKRYRNLKEFIQHAQQLRDTLQQHGHKIEDSMAILTVLSAIEYVDSSWVHLLEHDYTSGNLSWSKLTSLCMAKGNNQLTRAAFTTNTDKPAGQDESQAQSQSQDRQPPRYDDSLECEKCGKPGYALKDCWDGNGVPPEFRGRGRGYRGRDRGGQQHQNNTTSELEASQPQLNPHNSLNHSRRIQIRSQTSQSLKDC
jgi:hypothetical protein